nr:MAG TPA: hypothetical protein [Caudoviricetes sp.]
MSSIFFNFFQKKFHNSYLKRKLQDFSLGAFTSTIHF